MKITCPELRTCAQSDATARKQGRLPGTLAEGSPAGANSPTRAFQSATPSVTVMPTALRGACTQARERVKRAGGEMLMKRCMERRISPPACEHLAGWNPDYMYMNHDMNMYTILDCETYLVRTCSWERRERERSFGSVQFSLASEQSKRLEHSGIQASQ